MRLTRLFSLLFGLACCTLVRAQTCSVCNWNDNGTTSCGVTCTAVGPGCLGCYSTLLHNQVCYTGGCWQCIPAQGCFCQDQSGGTCGGQPCKKKTSAVSGQNVNDSLGLSLDVPLRETVWGQESTLLEDIRSHSPTLGESSKHCRLWRVTAPISTRAEGETSLLQSENITASAPSSSGFMIPGG